MGIGCLVYDSHEPWYTDFLIGGAQPAWCRICVPLSFPETRDRSHAKSCQTWGLPEAAPARSGE